jgi:hypothetical protein
MKAIITVVLAALFCVPLFAGSGEEVSQTVPAMERKAMDGWRLGNPDIFLSMADDGITFFHVMTEQRLDGLAAVRSFCESYRGTPLFDTYEMLDPKVQATSDVAVLTYRLVTHNGAIVRQWNATEIYQRKKEGWRIIHSHFSAAKTAAAGNR